MPSTRLDSGTYIWATSGASIGSDADDGEQRTRVEDRPRHPAPHAERLGAAAGSRSNSPISIGWSERSWLARSASSSGSAGRAAHRAMTAGELSCVDRPRSVGLARYAGEVAVVDVPVVTFAADDMVTRLKPATPPVPVTWPAGLARNVRPATRTSSMGVPKAVLGWTKATVVPGAGAGGSSMSPPPASFTAGVATAQSAAR